MAEEFLEMLRSTNERMAGRSFLTDTDLVDAVFKPDGDEGTATLTKSFSQIVLTDATAAEAFRRSVVQDVGEFVAARLSSSPVMVRIRDCQTVPAGNYGGGEALGQFRCVVELGNVNVESVFNAVAPESPFTDGMAAWVQPVSTWARLKGWLYGLASYEEDVKEAAGQTMARRREEAARQLRQLVFILKG
jgi:hypothetical protein